MGKIMDNYCFYRNREKIEKQTKYAKTSHLSREKKEKLYDYYKCDYCNGEIEIRKKRTEMTEGLVEIPYSLTGRAPLQLMLCNKCLKPVIKEFEEMRNGENHIPRIN